MSDYRLAVLADIHGNLPAFEAVLADLKDFAPLDRILVAGDTTTGPRQETIFNRLREMDAVFIQGNSEQWLCALDDGTIEEYYVKAKQFALGRWAYANLSREALGFMHTLPEQTVYHLPGTSPIRITHGSPRKINEGVYPNANPAQLDGILADIVEPVILFGHTHQPWQVQTDGRLALNPGAVCSPLNGQVGAQYALLDWDGERWQAHLRCVPYDLDLIRRDFIESGLMDSTILARGYLGGILTGRDATSAFITYAKNLARAAGFGDLPYIPNEVWDQAGATFAWENWPV